MSAVFSMPPRLDPQTAQVLAAPEEEGQGYWAGAPGAWSENGELTVVYRLRRPRPERGHLLRIVRREPSGHIDTLWEASRREIGTLSVERCALLRDPLRGCWRLWLCSVDPADNRWRIDMVESPDPSSFDLARRRPALTAASTATEGVKDPVVYVVGGLYYLFASIAPALPSARDDSGALHQTGDVFATGLLKSATGLAISQDGENWHWEGEVLSPNVGSWDAYAARITTVWPSDHGFLAFYDGSRAVDENYEERTGLAVSADLRSWTRVSLDGPVACSPWGSGSLRYADVVGEPPNRLAIYEVCRSDGSHDLRCQPL